MARPLTIGFGKFWEAFDPHNNLITDVLRELYDVRLGENPDLLFYSVFPGELPPAKKRVFFCGEPVGAPLNNTDWCISTVQNPSYFNRHHYLPYFAFEGRDLTSLLDKGPLVDKPHFCAFVYSRNIRFRDRFCRALKKTNDVHCPGSALNNRPPIGDYTEPQQSRGAADWRHQKIRYLSQFRFTIAMENRRQPGYATEKILDAMLAGSIPIYWGDPNIGEIFNPKSFISLHDEEGPGGVSSRWRETQVIERAIHRVRQIQTEPARLQEIWDEPWLTSNQLPSHYPSLRRFLQKAVESLD